MFLMILVVFLGLYVGLGIIRCLSLPLCLLIVGLFVTVVVSFSCAGTRNEFADNPYDYTYEGLFHQMEECEEEEGECD